MLWRGELRLYPGPSVPEETSGAWDRSQIRPRASSRLALCPVRKDPGRMAFVSAPLVDTPIQLLKSTVVILDDRIGMCSGELRRPGMTSPQGEDQKWTPTKRGSPAPGCSNFFGP